MPRIRVHFCGGCKAAFDRRAFLNLLVAELGRRSGRAPEIKGSAERADLSLVICGCSACCEDLDAHHENTKQSFVVGPDLLDYHRVSMDRIPDLIWQKLSHQ